jgi:CheY-like chemotaxis protein
MGLVKSKGPVVLIVEDEFLLRMDAVDMIAAAGFEVVEAANADEAIKILEAVGTSPWFSPISRCQARWTD